MSPSEIERIVRDQLPHLQAACDRTDPDTVVLNQVAFGTSEKELFLLAVAIKYAGIAKKHVMISAD